MHVVDLTLPVPGVQMWQDEWQGPLSQVESVQTRVWKIEQGCVNYHAKVHLLTLSGMAGTYVDFPGHIVETDNHIHAGNAPLCLLYRVPATLLRLQRRDGSGAVGPDELQGAVPAGGVRGNCLVVNALGQTRFDEIGWRSVYFSAAAVDWMITQKITLLISDIYESDNSPQDVFRKLFAAGVVTVCQPVNLHKIGHPHPFVTVLPLVMPGVTQLPCRAVAEWSCKDESYSGPNCA